MSRLLFVTWDGPETTYLEGLFLPIFAGLREHGVEVSVLQLTTGGAAVVERRAAAARACGIRYRGVLAPKWGTQAWILARGPDLVARQMRAERAEVLYPRSLLPLAACLVARRRDPSWKLLFDADGLVADERVDFAGWSPRGWRYRLYRDLEAEGIRAADAVITRTERAREVLLARAGPVPPQRVVVIPNGKDESLFAPGDPLGRAEVRRAAGVPDGAPWAVYAGSIGPQYNVAAMLAFHRAARALRPDARLALLALGDVPEAGGVPGVTVDRVSSSSVPGRLAAADLGLSLRTPTFSQRGVCPIKVGEYLLCGLPVLATRGVGDLDRQLSEEVAFFVDDFGPDSLAAAARWWVGGRSRDEVRERARARGVAEFGRGGVVARYAAVISGLGDAGGRAV